MLFPSLAVVVPLFSTLLALGLAVFVLSRNQRAWANRWLAIGLSSIGLHVAIMTVPGFLGTKEWSLPLYRLALAVAAAIPPTWFAFSLTFGETNGGSRLGRWRPALLVLAAVAPFAWFGLATGRVIQPIHFDVAGPLHLGLDAWGKLFFSAYLVGLVLVLLHLENLYRNAGRMTRWKIKFLVVGIFTAFAGQVVATSYALLYGMIHPLHSFFGSLAFLIGESMIAFSLVRHRLLNVDIFVSRYVIYRSLTLALAGGYLLSLGVVAEIFRWLDIPLDLLTGTFLTIFGAAALSLLLLSEDVRRKVKSYIHTHFYKHKYDYRKEWMEYTQRLSRAIAIPDIAVQTVNRILEVMWVRQAAMYTVGETPGHMTLAHRVHYDSLPTMLELDTTAVKALQEHATLIPSVAENGNHPDVMGELSRHIFGGVPVGLLVPVAALDNLVALLVVGPELSGKAFGVDDEDLLAAVAAQASALIVNARLSQEAAEFRELQALSLLSTFVAHDLKNAVSMLSMLAENAKHHMGKPEFQTDAVRTLGDVTARMRRLLVALASPGERTGVQIRRIGLAPSIEAWMQEIGAQIPSRIRIETRLDWTEDVRADPDQLRSVLHNLILNAVEATSGEGTILVETGHEDGNAILKVTDTGQGMTPDFVETKLFRPLQTTKSRGLGIGLYQCRQVVQALGGSLTAESQEGKGTRMVVKLPTQDVSVQRSEVSTTTS